MSHCPLEEPAGNTDPVLSPVSGTPGQSFSGPWLPLYPHALVPRDHPTPYPALWVTNQTLCKHLFSKGTRWKGRKEKIRSCSELWSHLSGARCPRKLGEEMASEPEVRHTGGCGRPCGDSGNGWSCAGLQAVSTLPTSLFHGTRQALTSGSQQFPVSQLPPLPHIPPSSIHCPKTKLGIGPT